MYTTMYICMYCLSFDLQLLIISLVTSNFSKTGKAQSMHHSLEVVHSVHVKSATSLMYSYVGILRNSPKSWIYGWFPVQNGIK